MKTALFVSLALMGASAAVAQDGYPPEPPGDGITRMGTNPEGQACTPPGFNVGINVYPDCVAMGGPLDDRFGRTPEGIDDYPPCTREVVDRCRQTYTRWTD